MRIVIPTGLVVLLSACVISCGGLAEKTEVGQTRQASTVDYFLKIDGIVGESQDNKHKNLVAIESFARGIDESGQTTGSVRVVFDCIESFCDGVTMTATPHGSGDDDGDAGAPPKLQGAWELLGPPGPDGNPLRAIMVVQDPGDGTLRTKLAAVEDFGKDDSASRWSTMMSASLLVCQTPPDCETATGDVAPAIDGATWECFPTCTPCSKCPK